MCFSMANYMHVSSFLWQSKYKKDTSTARPILFYEPEVEVYFFPCFTFLTHAYIPHFLWLDHPLWAQ